MTGTGDQERRPRDGRDELAVAIEAARMGTWEWDLGSGSLRWTGYLEAMHGMAPGTFDGAFDAGMRQVHPDDREGLRRRIERSLATGEHFSAEYRVIGRDGVERWIAGEGRVVREDGRPARMVGIARDVTEHRRTLDALRESEERFRAMADAAPVFIWIADSTGRRTYFNAEWLRFRGRSMAQELDDGWVEGVHPEDLDRAVDVYRDAVRRRTSYQSEYRLRRGDGEFRWMLVRGAPRLGPGGSFEGFVGCCVDITERREAEGRWRLLAEIGMVLDRPLSLEERLETLTRVLVPEVADACLVSLAGPDGLLGRAVVSHVDPALEARLRALPAPTAESPLTQVAGTREALLVPDVRERLDSRPPGVVADAVRRAWRSARSTVIVPLVARARLVGVLAMATSRGHSDRPMDEGDLRLAREIAARAALAIDNARLFDAERQAARRVRFLSEASRLLGSSLDERRALRQTAALAVPALADWCAVHLVDESGRLEVVALAHPDAAAARRALERARAAPPPADAAAGPAAVLRTGRPEMLAEPRDPEGPPARDGAPPEPGRVPYVCVPVIARGETLGAVTLLADGASGRRFGEEDLALATELAERAAAAVDNARLYRAQHGIADTLQRALLPPSLPDLPGARLGAAYLAMGRGVEAGGDFYDVVPCAGGRWAVVVGDVCGKGPEAAALTALARYTLRAIARRDADPGRMLVELNRDIVHQRPGNTQFLTACLGLLDAADGGLRVRLASAGHPPALVARADGSVERATATGAFVGVLPEIEMEPCELLLGAGERLVIYTDGLVEARTGAGALLGEAGVMEALPDLGDLPASDLARALAQLARQGADARLRDDVAVLVVEATPP